MMQAAQGQEQETRHADSPGRAADGLEAAGKALQGTVPETQVQPGARLLYLCVSSDKGSFDYVSLVHRLQGGPAILKRVVNGFTGGIKHVGELAKKATSSLSPQKKPSPQCETCRLLATQS